MKKLKIILLILLMFICTTTINAEEMKKHNFDNTIKVYDYAQVLSDDVEEEKLKELVLSYTKKHNIDMVLVTSRHDKGTNTKEYMKKFYETYNFGIGDSKDGIIIVIDFNGTDVNTEILSLGKAKDIYNDNRISNMLNNIKSNEKYFDKFKEFIKEAKTEYDEEIKKGRKVELVGEDIDSAIEKINECVSEGAVIYTKNPDIAYKFVNLVKSKNVFVNATLLNSELVEKSNNDLLMNKKIMYELRK